LSAERTLRESPALSRDRLAKIIPVHCNDTQTEAVRLAVEAMREGQLVVLPTDTVYGLACDPFSAEACRQVFVAKGRDETKPLALLLSDLEATRKLTGPLPQHVLKLLRESWPGPVTALLPASRDLPSHLGKDGKIGLRVPACLLTQSVAREMGGAIAATSANLTGRPPCQSAHQVEAELGRFVRLILDAGRLAGAPSRILDLCGEHPVETTR
jgi:tRNA threonylcarbamoyl adenosine modification protein (Sua5/YciO/YrdC/YwlC family)